MSKGELNSGALERVGEIQDDCFIQINLIKGSRSPLAH